MKDNRVWVVIGKWGWGRGYTLQQAKDVCEEKGSHLQIRVFRGEGKREPYVDELGTLRMPEGWELVGEAI